MPDVFSSMPSPSCLLLNNKRQYSGSHAGILAVCVCLPVKYIVVGCAQTAAVLDESMSGGMGDRWDFIIGWLID